jgi:cell division protease FtsH
MLHTILPPGRFDRQVLVDRPDLAGRDAILRIHSQKVKLGADVDLKAIATRTPGFAGADLANLVNEISVKPLLKKTLPKRLSEWLPDLRRKAACSTRPRKRLWRTMKSAMP